MNLAYRYVLHFFISILALLLYICVHRLNVDIFFTEHGKQCNEIIYAILLIAAQQVSRYNPYVKTNIIVTLSARVKYLCKTLMNQSIRVCFFLCVFWILLSKIYIKKNELRRIRATYIPHRQSHSE